ncbi:MAG TPA: ester cyclase [Solirubrobacteraceae bacterium]
MSTAASALDLDTFCARYLAAWNDHDPGAMGDLITEDIVWEDPALPGPARGVAAVQEFMRGSWVAFPDLRFDETDSPHCTAAGDQVAWRWRMRGTMSGPLEPPGFAATGRSMEVEGVDLWTMREGRIARYRAFYDLNDLARQLAIAPPPGSRAERAMVRLQRLQARMLSRRG